MKSCPLTASAKITIEERTITQSSLGEPIDSWVTIAQPWAEIRHKEGDETFDSDQQYARGKTEFKIRHSQSITINAQSRVLFDGEIFDILDWHKVPAVRARHLVLIGEARRD